MKVSIPVAALLAGSIWADATPGTNLPKARSEDTAKTTGKSLSFRTNNRRSARNTGMPFLR
ncbi:MAG: hypothetical protein ACYS67_16495 [Planctomycetota bacterium]